MSIDALREAFVKFRERAAKILCETRGHSGYRPCDFCLNVTLFAPALSDGGEWVSVSKTGATWKGPVPTSETVIHPRTVSTSETDKVAGLG